ncbi:MAG TPA: hypothetical protein DD666_08780 [Advenella kashmirensis]|uniref:Uncharacterized protein n=1 Tax=Advenella kashmirensis TaxID=310575 RepID=A0A356LG75_9BURK|nr:hypothetical protein [Advenella kashmirensis]
MQSASCNGFVKKGRKKTNPQDSFFNRQCTADYFRCVLTSFVISNMLT